MNSSAHGKRKYKAYVMSESTGFHNEQQQQQFNYLPSAKKTSSTREQLALGECKYL